MITKIALLCAFDDSKLYCIIEGKTQKKGNLFLSNIMTAVDKPLIKNKNIKAIVTVAKGCVLPYSKEQVPNYLYIPIEDKPHYNISEYFQKCLHFIQKNLSKTNVLVHCKAGISRSATIVLSYLMIKNNHSLKQAFEYVKKIQPCIKPNKGFMKQLEQLHLQIHGYSSQKIFETTENRGLRMDVELKGKGKSLSLLAQKLQKQNQRIISHIGQIKKLCEDNVQRTRSKSEYLRTKLKEAREKKSGLGKDPSLTILKKLK